MIEVKANRLNAQKSTGPRTAEGKTIVSKNALKHGLFVAENVIFGEKQADFDHFCEEWLTEQTPIALKAATCERNEGIRSHRETTIPIPSG